jgi:hypothetical protein
MQNYASRANGPKGDSSNVQGGTNIYTGGTSLVPIINIVDSPSFNQITASGATSLQSLSATTIFSGTTELSTFFCKSGQATVDFGFSTGNEGDTASVIILSPFVSINSIITCSPSVVATADHLASEGILEGLVASAGNITASTGFEIVVIAPQNTWGRYAINYAIN